MIGQGDVKLGRASKPFHKQLQNEWNLNTMIQQQMVSPVGYYSSWPLARSKNIVNLVVFGCDAELARTNRASIESLELFQPVKRRLLVKRPVSSIANLIIERTDKQENKKTLQASPLFFIRLG